MQGKLFVLCKVQFSHRWKGHRNHTNDFIELFWGVNGLRHFIAFCVVWVWCKPPWMVTVINGWTRPEACRHTVQTTGVLVALVKRTRQRTLFFPNFVRFRNQDFMYNFVWRIGFHKLKSTKPKPIRSHQIWESETWDIGTTKQGFCIKGSKGKGEAGSVWGKSIGTSLYWSVLPLYQTTSLHRESYGRSPGRAQSFNSFKIRRKNESGFITWKFSYRLC